jgi:xanthosine utilization system XapX-like protein
VQVRSAKASQSCDNQGMGKQGRWIVVLVAGIGLVLGFVVAALLGVRITDPAVQGAVVGAVAGIAGGFVGAAVGAWASRDIANRTIADAREARWEARQDAKDALFLQERRAAIVAALASGDAAVSEAKRVAHQVDEPNSPPPRPDLLDDFRKAWMELTLLAPDVTSGYGSAFSESTVEVAMAYTNWAHEQIADVRAGTDLSPLPRSISEAETKLNDALATFMVAAMASLGVLGYAQPPDVEPPSEGRSAPAPN